MSNIPTQPQGPHNPEEHEALTAASLHAKATQHLLETGVWRGDATATTIETRLGPLEIDDYPSGNFDKRKPADIGDNDQAFYHTHRESWLKDGTAMLGLTIKQPPEEDSLTDFFLFRAGDLESNSLIGGVIASALEPETDPEEFVLVSIKDGVNHLIDPNQIPAFKEL